MKYQKSNITKKYSRLSKIFGLISVLITVFPLGFYVIKAFATGDPHEKFTLGIFVVMAAIFTLLNIVFKMHLRSTIWLMLLGIYIVMDNILPLLLMVAIGTILDEIIISPLHKKYKNKAVINYEIDKRS